LLEIEKIKRYLKTNGYETVNSPGKADYIMLATCAFKKKEEEHSIRRLKDLRKYKTDFLVYGCLPDISPEKYREFEQIKHIAPKDLDTIDKFFDDIRIRFDAVPESNLIEMNRQKPLLGTLKKKVSNGEIFRKEFYDRAKRRFAQEITKNRNELQDFYLYICRGCLGKCSYCAIRRAVGSVKSKKPAEIIKELYIGHSNGYLNFKILGDDPGCYGLDIGTDFPNLLSDIVDKSHELNTNANNGISLYINEIHPKFIIMYADALLQLMKRDEIKGILCPVQSGSARILELMKREHTPARLHSVINKIKNANSNIKITTQIIVGFPSESDTDFFDTLNFLKNSAFSEVTIFPYHDKKNTYASKLDHKIPEPVILERVKTAKQFLKQNRIAAYEKCIV
jgi:MiaB/RimO family radical SAM methylthiotransferase